MAVRLRTTMSMTVLRENGVVFKPLEGWCSIPHLARLLGITYQGAQYQVFDAQVFDFDTDVRIVCDKVLVIREEAARRFVESRGMKYVAE